MDSIAMVSGGLGSVVMLHHAVKVNKYEPHVLIFDYRQRCAKEIDCALYQAADLGLTSKVIPVTLGAPQWVESDGYETYIPARNLVFLSMCGSASEELGVHKILTGFHKNIGPHMFWDTTTEFMAQFNALFDLSGYHIRVEAPLWELNKPDIIKLGTELGVDYTQTWSCLVPGDKACGECPCCVSRLKYFRRVGLEDPLDYENR